MEIKLIARKELVEVKPDKAPILNKQTNNSQTQTTVWCLPVGKAVREVEEVKRGISGDGGLDQTWGGEHTIQYTDDVSQNCTLEAYIISLTNKIS